MRVLRDDYGCAGWRGEMAHRIQEFDWSTTSLGQIDRWSSSLRAAVQMLLASPVPLVILWGRAGHMIYNDSYSVFAGGRHPFLLGSPVEDGWPEVAAFNRNVVDTCLAGGTLSYRDKELVLFRNGVAEDVWMDLYYSPVVEDDGSPAGVIAIVIETTERVRGERRRQEAETAFRATNERLQLALNSGAVLGSFVWDIKANLLTGDERFARTFSYPAELFERGLPLAAATEIIHPDDIEHVNGQIARTLADGVPYNAEYRIRRPEDGQYRWILASGRCDFDGDGEPTRFPGVLVDIHERKVAEEGLIQLTRNLEQRVTDAVAERIELEEQLRQSQKMEAIGKLTGGVAHDFNNVLQVLRGNLELLEARHARDEWTRERLDKAVDAVERGATLAAQLLAFGRRQALQPLVVNLAGLLRNMDDLLRRALGETIAVETIVSGGLWNTQVDPHQLENVILNLAINGRDAMKNGGKLTLELANAMLDDQYVATLTDVAPGQYVMLAVTDTGTGMPAQVAAQAFEPFFTTKPEGEGTGLGLSMAYGFIKQSGGHIKLYSEIGHGTTVKIYLPRSMEAAVEPAARHGAVLVGGNETILVVEDDPKVQSTVVDTLSELGYGVLKADDAQSALTIIHSGVHIDLLFTDVVMPGPMRSPEMARRAVAILPHLRVLFTSGYTQNAIVHGGRLDPGVELLSKPYSREQLAYKIRQMLKGATGPVNVRRKDTVAEAQPVTVPSATSLRILVVEDHDDSREAICEVLTMLGHRPHGVGSGEEALANLGAQTFEVLLTDISLPGMSGIELAHKATDVTPALRCVFASGRDLPHDANFPFEWLALRKPYTGEQIQAILFKLCSRG